MEVVRGSEGILVDFTDKLRIRSAYRRSKGNTSLYLVLRAKFRTRGPAPPSRATLTRNFAMVTGKDILPYIFTYTGRYGACAPYLPLGSVSYYILRATTARVRARSARLGMYRGLRGFAHVG